MVSNIELDEVNFNSDFWKFAGSSRGSTVNNRQQQQQQELPQLPQQWRPANHYSQAFYRSGTSSSWSTTKLTLTIILTTILLVLAAAAVAALCKYLQDTPSISQKASEDQNNTTVVWHDPKVALLEFRRAYVRNMTVAAFGAYRKYAWGSPELAPISKKGTYNNHFGYLPGQTIVQGMSTLWIMELTEEWAAGREWIASQLRLGDVDAIVNVDSTLSSYIGALLSAYALSGDQMFLLKAIEACNAVPREGLFSKGAGALPQKFNPLKKEYLGGLYFNIQVPSLIYLFNLTKNQDIGNWLAEGRAEMRKENGHHTFEKDTFFWQKAEYAWREVGEDYFNMIRSYNQLGQWDTELLELFLKGIESVTKEGHFRTVDGQVYVNDFNLNRKQFENFMYDWHCRLGSLFALSSAAYQKINYPKKAKAHLDLAINITRTCHWKAKSTITKMLPNKFSHSRTLESATRVDSYLSESYFFLYRLTGDETYREWAWELALAINRHFTTPSGGFSGLKAHSSVPAERDDHQPANLLSNTFMYLYLIFSDGSKLPLDKWIFTRTGNPLPICGTNQYYPKEMCAR